MRIFLLLFAFTVFLSAEERFCIEAISVEKKTDISKDFIRKLSKISLTYEYKEVDGQHKVFVGDFITRKEAEEALAEIQDVLNKDAFVTAVSVGKKTENLSAQAQMQKAALMAQAKMLTKPDDKEKTPKAKTIEIPGPQEKLTITRTDKKIGSRINKTKKSKKIKQKLVCKTTKKALREEEISEALSFYKSSSFYSFKN